jgi:hypothetical protein
MERTLNPLGISNTPGGIALSRIVTSQRSHVATPILILCYIANPMFGVFTLKKPDKQVMNTPGVCNKILAR